MAVGQRIREEEKKPDVGVTYKVDEGEFCMGSAEKQSKFCIVIDYSWMNHQIVKKDNELL